MINISKINSDGNLEANIVSYSLNNLIDALVCYLEQLKFKDKIQKTKFGGACYYISETNESYYANTPKL
mgnify:CR=1 FL=1